MNAVSAPSSGRSRRLALGRMTAPAPRRRSSLAPTVASAPPLRIAMLAPPWISVPPPGYGGVETVVSALTEALVAQGHEVTLFCAPGSVSRATVMPLLARAHPDEIERSLYEVDHVGQAFDLIDLAAPARRFDVIHDHCGFTGLAMAGRIDTPLVHTLHGPFDTETAAFYAQHGHKASLVAISRSQLDSAPAGLETVATIPNPIDLRAWPLQERKGDYLLWVGRMTPEKGPHHAIAAAKAVDVPLILAGVIQPGQQAFFDAEIAPHLDGERVRFLGEIGGATKRSLFAKARGLLMPIRWNEPFGMVMIEALACGTPVIAFPEGAARELVVDGETGFLVEDGRAMADAIGRLSTLDPRDCRRWVSEHCDRDVVAAAYARVYAQTARSHPAVLAAAAALRAPVALAGAIPVLQPVTVLEPVALAGIDPSSERVLTSA